MIDVRIGGRLLRRHVGGCSHRDARSGERRSGRGLADGFGDTEVGDERVPPAAGAPGVSAEHHVLRLDIAMYDALSVRVRQRVEHLLQ